MTAAHKAALAAGRDESRAVRAYLEALESVAPKRRGRRRTPDSIKTRLATVAAALPDAAPLNRLQLLQEKTDLERELTTLTNARDVDLTALRKAFIKAAKSYGQRKGIQYATWRAAGVDAATLKDAGITRSS